jgi:phage replication-related protein YjqB (UPF0714/DUF867 family)
MKTFFRSLSIFALVAATATPSYGQFGCIELVYPYNIKVSLLSSAGVPETSRREFVEISDDLAAELGITAADIDPDDAAPNPQIRLRIYSAPAGSGIAGNSAVFTVVAIRNVAMPPLKRVWVYAGADKNSGQFKLFAKANNTLVGTPDSSPFDDILDNVSLRALPIPVSSSTFQSGGSSVATQFYCETSSGKFYVESAVREASDQVVAIAPHGGKIEEGTSDQVDYFATAFATLESVPVNTWKLEGEGGMDQTFPRWHITSTSIDIASYPGLADLLPPGGSFDYAVAFHGFGGSSAVCMGTPGNKRRELILGGRAPQKLKCAIAGKIVDAMGDAVPSLAGSLAISIRHYGGTANIEIRDICNEPVSESGLSGIGLDNIVNRLATNGGIQLEQSKNLREHGVLLKLVADATAAGLAQFLANPGAAYCAPFID